MSTYIQEIREALAVTITDEDIRILVDATRRKALHNATIAAELKNMPDSNGKTRFSIKHNYGLYQLWRIILLGPYNRQNFASHIMPFISVETAIHWLRIIYNTLDNHFSGEIAEVGKINALNFLSRFIYEGEQDEPPARKIDFSITCAAQVLICCSFSSYLILVC